MDITVHRTTLPHDDPDASPAFRHDVLGFEVSNHVGDGHPVATVADPGGNVPELLCDR